MKKVRKSFLTKEDRVRIVKEVEESVNKLRNMSSYLEK